MVMEQLNTEMETSFGRYKLQRYPLSKKETMKAWDAADEYVLHYLDENKLLQEDTSLLIINDNFGALSIPLSKYQPIVISDSYISMQAISMNVQANDIGLCQQCTQFAYLRGVT